MLTDREVYQLLFTDPIYNRWFQRNDHMIPSFSYVYSRKPYYIRTDSKLVHYVYCRYCQNTKFMFEALQQYMKRTCHCGTNKCASFECHCGFNNLVNEFEDIDVSEMCKCKCVCDRCKSCFVNKTYKDVAHLAFHHRYDMTSNESPYLSDTITVTYGCLHKYRNRIYDVPVNSNESGKGFADVCKDHHLLYHDGDDDLANQSCHTCGWEYWAESLKSTFDGYCTTASAPDPEYIIEYKQVGIHDRQVMIDFPFHIHSNYL